MLPWIGLLLLTQADRTTFQTGQPYRPSIAIPADAAIVYGFNNDMPGRVKSWKDQGYTVQLMTGVAWGQYQDYLYGRFDGKNHEDEAQTDEDGNKISHGGDVYYMSPGPSYGKYLAAGVRKALDVGVDSIYLEEPEFWVRAGYSPAFKREWQDFYHEPWQAPDSSPEAQWRASKLKYFLYRRALQQVFVDVQLYNKEHGRNVHCYLATHSLLNYSSWSIVSPESSLAQLKGCDGYIAQVWTGTARTPNYYQGELKERTFETAYLEYGAMMNVARATGKRLWFLADPVEDDPKHDWGDYKRNYEATVTASLLQPDVSNYEVMPWPERVFEGQYPSEADPKVKVGIPRAYATELQLVDNALSQIGAVSSKRTMSGAKGVGVVVSDTLMFERAGPSPSDPQLGQFYGLALPFVENGVPVQPVQLETATASDLSRYGLLLMTYRGMKPMSPEADDNLVAWVKKGGVLIFVDDDGDPFNHIREWWNSDGRAFETPRESLFKKLNAAGLTLEALDTAQKVYEQTVEASRPSTRGHFYWLKKDPAALARSREGANELFELARGPSMFKVNLRYAGGIASEFGPYAALYAPARKSAHEPDYPASLLFDPNLQFGRIGVVDLFDPNLRLQQIDSLEGPCHFLITVPSSTSSVHMLALAGKCDSQAETKSVADYTIKGIEGTNGIALLDCQTKPTVVTLNGQNVTDTTYDMVHHLLWVRFTNSAKSRTLEVKL